MLAFVRQILVSEVIALSLMELPSPLRLGILLVTMSFVNRIESSSLFN